MSPEEVKPWIDMLIALLAAGGGGATLLAFIGYKKAKAEKEPEAPRPQVGGGALAQIGGMVMGQQTAQDIIAALQGIASSHDRCTVAREAEMLARKVQWAEYQTFKKKMEDERRDHELRLSRDAHNQYTQLVDVIGVLSRRVEQMPSCNN